MKQSSLTKLKKALALTTVLLLLVCFAGCWNNDEPDSTGDTQSQTPAPSTSEPTDAPPVPSTEAPTTVATTPVSEAPATEATDAPTEAPTQPPATEAPSGKNVATVTAEKLNIRANAGVGYKQVGSYYKNDKIEILETKNGWGRTDKGWIFLDYVKLEPGAELPGEAEKPIDSNIVNDGKTTKLGHGVVTLDILNVRSGPGTKYEKLGTVTRGNRYAYYQKSDNWVRIDQGWISVSYFYLEGTTGEGAGTGTIHTADLNIRSGPGLEFDKVGTYARGETVKILMQMDKWGYTEKGWVSMSYVAMKQHLTGMGTVTPDTLNIRKQAKVESEQVGTYSKGDRIEILETLGDWGRTDKGWVFLDYVKMDAAAAGAKTVVQTQKGTVTASILNIRKDANLKSDTVGGYKKGDKVEILETKNGWGRTDKGWISLEYVKMDT